MTLTKPRSATRGNSRYHWVPAAAGWTVGVIATLSLLASVSPLIRWIIKVPREFINDYLFNFPDTNFAWSFVLALLAAALTARKRIAWLVLLANMVLAAVVNAAEIAAGGNTAAESFGENLGFAVHVVAIVVLVLGYREFWAKVRRGALFRAAAVWLAGAVVGIVASWGLVELFPGSLAPDNPKIALRKMCGLPVNRSGSERTNPLSAGYWICMGRTTHWATSPPVATSRWYSHPAAAPVSPTVSRSVSA